MEDVFACRKSSGAGADIEPDVFAEFDADGADAW